MNTIASRSTEILLPAGGRAVITPTKVKDVVTIAGSILAGPAAFPHGSDAAVSMTADLLDAGAGRLGKQAFRDALANRGAEISFAADGTRLSWSASCFPEDTPFVIERIADALLRPQLPASELGPEKARTLTELADEASDTRTQAESAATRLIYPANHPLYTIETKRAKELVIRASLADLKAVARQFGARHLALSVVGDVPTAKVAETIERAFGKAPEGRTRPSVAPAARGVAGRADIVIKDKANADVVMAAALGFNTDDKRYLPTFLVTHALGGSFASHLMQTVRERDGLTYGTKAHLLGLSDKLDGYLRIWGTFAPEFLMRGIEALQHETALFLREKFTEEQLAKTKEEVAGSYAVSLSTTSGLAARIVRFIEDDRPLTRVDEYPSLVERVTFKEATDAAAHLASLPLSVVTAGSTVL